MNTRQDLKASGGTSIAGGEYASVRVSGALKVNGTLDCEELHASGGTKIAGDLRCSGRISASGALKVEGSVSSSSIGSSGALVAGGDVAVTGELHTSGSLTSGAKLSADVLKTSGVCRCNEIHVRELATSGQLAVDGGVEAERFRSSGKLDIRELLNAEEIDISISAACAVGDIGGSRITVRKGWFGIAFGHPRLTVESIEGDTVELEYTKAATVRARTVRIGAGCEIGRVEYSETISVEGGTVGEQVKL